MNTLACFPEGARIDTPENQAVIADAALLERACADGTILEARVSMCDSAHNMWISLPCMQAMIPREEGAVGIAEGELRDIALIARVGKPVCFRVTRIDTQEDGSRLAILSRRAVQEECYSRYLNLLSPGDIIDARVTHLEPFGAFVDIGCGIASMIPIDAISVSRIVHPSDRFTVGQAIRVIVKGRQGKRICLSHKELLGTWEENAASFSPGQTVRGIVRGVEPYGIFIELAPNLSGLSEYRDDVEQGDEVAVYIKSMDPAKMKIKLVIVGRGEKARPAPLRYFAPDKLCHVYSFIYSPKESARLIRTDFN